MSAHRDPPLAAEPPGPAVFVVQGPLVPGDIPELCEQARAMLADLAPGTPVECDVTGLGTPDVTAVDALARLQLTARRLGFRVQLRGASPQLRVMLRRSGLCEAVPLADRTGG